MMFGEGGGRGGGGGGVCVCGRKSDDDSEVSAAPDCQPARLLMLQTICSCHLLIRCIWCSRLSLVKR